MAPKWIHFTHLCPSTSGKTDVWLVESNEGGELLGRIAWYSNWRQYAFYPRPQTVFERQCLREIAAFCEKATQEHRSARERGRADAAI